MSDSESIKKEYKSMVYDRDYVLNDEVFDRLSEVTGISRANLQKVILDCKVQPVIVINSMPKFHMYKTNADVIGAGVTVMDFDNSYYDNFNGVDLVNDRYYCYSKGHYFLEVGVHIQGGVGCNGVVNLIKVDKSACVIWIKVGGWKRKKAPARHKDERGYLIATSNVKALDT